MVFHKITKCAALTVFIAITSFLADENPDVRQCVEITKQTWREMSSFIIAKNQFSNKEQLNEKSFMDSKQECAKSIETYKKAFQSYSKIQTKEKLIKKEEAHKNLLEAQQRLEDVISAKLQIKTEFINDLIQHLDKLRESYNKLADLAENYTDFANALKSGALNYQIKESIIIAGEPIQQMLESATVAKAVLLVLTIAPENIAVLQALAIAPEDKALLLALAIAQEDKAVLQTLELAPEDKILLQAMETVNKQAVLYMTLDTMEVVTQIRKQVEILATLASSMKYVKQNLEEQKGKFKKVILYSTIDEILNEISKRKFIDNAICVIPGDNHIMTGMENINDLLNDTGTGKDKVANEGDQPFGAWQRLKDSK